MDDVPNAEELVGLELWALLAWAAELTNLTGNASGAAALVCRAIELAGASAGARLHEHLGAYVIATGDVQGAVAACTRAVERAPAQPPSAERAQALATLGTTLMIAWRHADSRAACEEAIAVADAVQDDSAAIRAQGPLGVDLCYLGDPERALALLHGARQRAQERRSHGDRLGIAVQLADVLCLTGRFRESRAAAWNSGAGLIPS